MHIFFVQTGYDPKNTRTKSSLKFERWLIMKLRFHKLTALILVLAMMVPFLAACKEEPVNLQEIYKFSETAVTLNAGENYALLVYDDTYSDRAYTATWTSDNPAVVSVEQSGFITALNAGSATVTATLFFAEEDQTVTLNCSVTVLQTTVAVTGISLNAMEQTLDVGGVTVLTPTVLPADATNKAVSWTSSNPAVAIVSSGVITAVGEGTAIISAITEDGAKQADCVVTVLAPVDTFESLTLNKTSASVTVGKTLSLTATVKPQGVAADIIWTSGDESIATVVNGTITGVSAGTTTITATLNDKVTNKVATCKVTVKSASSGTTSSGNSGNSSSGNSSSGNSGSTGTSTTVKATSVKFDVQSITVYVGQKGPWKFNPTVTPSNTTEKGKWTSNNPSVAAVDSNGNITIGNIGDSYFEMATITYTVGTKSASGVVVVMSEASNPNPDSGSTGNTGTGNTGTGNTGTGNTGNTGDSTGTGSGNTGNTGSTNNDGTKKITDLILAEDDIDLIVGQVYAVEFDAYPKDAVETYEWTSSNESVVTVTSSGVLTGKAPGTAKITVKGIKSGISADCIITVKHKTAEAILISPTSVALNLGQTVQLTYNLTPGDATDTVTWSSQYPSIVSVDQKGNITALQSGIVEITATTSTGKTAKCTVNSGITGTDFGGATGTPTGNKIKVSVYVGATGDLKAGNAYTAYLTFSPSLTQAQLSTLMYAINSSDSSVANVTRPTNDFTKNSFVVTPGKDGSAKLTGYVNSSDPSLVFEFESGAKTVVVNSPDASITSPITSITMVPTSKAMYIGDSATIVASVLPVGHNDQISWSSSDDSIVKVVGSGLSAYITALKPGTATITCKSKGNLVTNGRTATCTVTVNSTGSIDSTRGVIAVSQGTTYTPTLTDIGITGTLVYAPSWIPANTVVNNIYGSTSTNLADYTLSIDSTGKISVGDNVPIGTAISTSVTYVEASAPTTLVKKDFTVMVLSPKPSSSTSVSTVNISADVGDAGTLSQYSFTGATYASNQTDVISVDANTGAWTALKAGSATVSIKVNDTIVLEVRFTVDYKEIEHRVSKSSTYNISTLLGSAVVGKVISGIPTSSNTSKAIVTVAPNNSDFIVTTLDTSGSVRITVSFTDGSKAYINLTIGSSGSTTTANPTLSASSTTVKGGNGVTLTLSNCPSYSTVTWSMTDNTGKASLSQNSTISDLNNKASVVLSTGSVESQKTIVVYANIGSTTVASLTITVNP